MKTANSWHNYELSHWSDYRVKETLLAQNKPMFSFRLTCFVYKQLVRLGFLPSLVIL